MQGAELTTVRWFGDSWGAPVNSWTDRIEVPSSARCAEPSCGETLAGNQGVALYGGNVPLSRELFVVDVRGVNLPLIGYHLDCFKTMLGLRAPRHGD